MTFLKRYSPEHYIIITLVILAAVNITQLTEIIHVISAVVVASVVDVFLFYVRNRKKQIPTLAIISGLIIGLVLIPDPVMGAAAALIAMLSKHIISWKGRNVFNPAAFGLLATMILFSTVTTWWGVIHWLIVPLGLLVAWRIGRLTTSFSFLIAYFVIFFIQAPLLSQLTDYTLYFFAFIMVLEPVTSPFVKKGKIIFGAGIAVLVQIFAFIPTDIFLLALLIMNLLTQKLNKVK